MMHSKTFLLMAFITVHISVVTLYSPSSSMQLFTQHVLITYLYSLLYK